jgi:hypothetical protein
MESKSKPKGKCQKANLWGFGGKARLVREGKSKPKGKGQMSEGGPLGVWW